MVEASAGFRIDPGWYRSRERAEKEWRHVWTRTWHMGPRVEELAGPGDAMVHSLGRESLVFLKTAEGDVRGFFNVCPHRGNRLILAGDGPAFAPAFRCAFHGWRFGQDGALQDAPYADRFGCELAKLARLKPFRVEAWAGWLWYTLDPDAPPLDTYLGALKPKLEAYRLDRATIVDYKTFEFRANWKTVLDAFNESYHFQTLHADILAWGNEDAPITMLGIHQMMVNEYGAPSRLYPDQQALNPALEAYLRGIGIDPAGFSGSPAEVRLAAQRIKRAAADSVFPYATLSDSQLTDAYHYLLFPSLHLNLFPEFYVAMRYRPHPGGDPERSYFDFIMCAPLQPGETVPPYEHRVVRGGSEPVADVLQWGVRAHPIAAQVLAEDVDLVEHVQAGVGSMAFDGPILGRDERRIEHFHEALDRLISGETVAALIAEATP